MSYDDNQRSKTRSYRSYKNFNYVFKFIISSFFSVACVTMPHLHLWFGSKQQQVVLQEKEDWQIPRPGMNGDKSSPMQLGAIGQVNINVVLAML